MYGLGAYELGHMHPPGDTTGPMTLCTRLFLVIRMINVTHTYVGLSLRRVRGLFHG